MTHTTPPAADTPVTPADILRGAAVYLARHGWIQEAFYATTDTLTPAACVVGALAFATTGQHLDNEDEILAHPDLGATIAFLVDHLHEGSGDSTFGLTYWNDEPDMTAELVIRHLHDAAHIWDTTHAHH